MIMLVQVKVFCEACEEIFQGELDMALVEGCIKNGGRIAINLPRVDGMPQDWEYDGDGYYCPKHINYKDSDSYWR